jgi:hypothetical protein
MTLGEKTRQRQLNLPLFADNDGFGLPQGGG